MARGLGKNKRGFANSAVTTTVTTSASADIDLYLPFDSDLNDDSTNSHSVTAQNSAAVTTSVKKFGAGSGNFINQSDCIDISGGQFEFGSNDFTIELWAYMTSDSNSAATVLEYYLPNAGNVVANGTGNYSYGFRINLRRGGGFECFIGLDNGQVGWLMFDYNSAAAIPFNTWTHYAITREGSTFRAFKDGSLIQAVTGKTSAIAASIGDSNYPAGATLRVGSSFDSINDGIRGYLDDVRITNGAALYTAAFTPPTSAVGLTAEVTTTTTDNKFLSSVWSLKDQNKKISKGEWIRNDADTGVDGRGRSIKGSGLEVFGHRHYSGPGITGSGGGEITTPTHVYHVFTSPGTFTMTGAEGQVEYLVVGGGGHGGPGSNWPDQLGGGGGGGGVRQGFLDPLTPGSYPITVGNGGGDGVPAWNPSTAFSPSYNGSPSTFATITAAGGGAGGRPSPTQSGQDGSSGGGAGYGRTDYGTGNTPPTTPPQGNPGGTGSTHPSNSKTAGGGGGAGGAGVPGQGGSHGGLGVFLPQFSAPILSPVIGTNTDLGNVIGPAGFYGAGGGGAVKSEMPGPFPYDYHYLRRGGGGPTGAVNLPYDFNGRYGYGHGALYYPSGGTQGAHSGGGAGHGGGGHGIEAGAKGGKGIVIIRYLKA